MPIPYKKFIYFYPPRPEMALPASDLKNYDPQQWIAQPKLNGSNASVWMYRKQLEIWNRHKSKFKKFEVDVSSLFPRNEWYGINGEYMNKSQTDLNGKLFNHKLVIFDMLVHKSKYLMGTTFEERYNMLLDLLNPTESYDPYLWQIRDDVFLVKVLDKDFFKHYHKMCKAKMYEGLVMKKRSAKMQSGLRQNNTALEQFKFRKATKNYTY